MVTGAGTQRDVHGGHIRVSSYCSWLNLTPDYLTALLVNINPDDSKHRNEVLKEIAKLDPNEARYVLLESVTAEESEEALFAVNKLFEIKDEELIPDLEEVVDKIQPVILEEILSRMTDEDRTQYSRFLQKIRKRLSDPSMQYV